MSIFSSRPPGYKAGAILLLISTVTFFVGFVSPFWTEETGNRNVTQGLWMHCNVSCTFLSVQDSWYFAFQTLETVCLAALLAAGYFCFHVNYCTVNYSRFLEVVAGVGGIMGFSGAILFLGMSFKNNISYFWAFYLATLGSGLAVIAAAVIAGSNKPNLQIGTSIATPTTQESIFTWNEHHNQAYASKDPNTRYDHRAGNDINRSSLQHPRDISAVYSAYSQERHAPMEDVHTRYNRNGYGQSRYSTQTGNRNQACFGQPEYGLSRYSGSTRRQGMLEWD